MSEFGVNLVRIQSECGKIRTTIIPNTDTQRLSVGQKCRFPENFAYVNWWSPKLFAEMPIRPWQINFSLQYFHILLYYNVCSSKFYMTGFYMRAILAHNGLNGTKRQKVAVNHIKLLLLKLLNYYGACF